MHPENTKFLTRWREKNFSNDRPCCNAGPSSKGLIWDSHSTEAMPAWTKQQMLLMVRSAPGFGYYSSCREKHWPFLAVFTFSEKKTKSFSLNAYWLFFFSTHTFSVYVCRQARSPCSQLMVLLHSTFCCPADQGSPRTPIWEMLPLSQEQGALHLVWLKPVSSNWISPRWLINYGSFPTAGNSYHHLQSLS